jgi:hypothetical protein
MSQPVSPALSSLLALLARVASELTPEELATITKKD